MSNLYSKVISKCLDIAHLTNLCNKGMMSRCLDYYLEVCTTEQLI